MLLDLLIDVGVGLSKEHPIVVVVVGKTGISPRLSVPTRVFLTGTAVDKCEKLFKMCEKTANQGEWKNSWKYAKKSSEKIAQHI